MSEAERNMLTEEHHDIVNPQKVSQKKKNPLDVFLFMIQHEKMGGREKNMWVVTAISTDSCVRNSTYMYCYIYFNIRLISQKTSYCIMRKYLSTFIFFKCYKVSLWLQYTWPCQQGHISLKELISMVMPYSEKFISLNFKAESKATTQNDTPKCWI